MSVVDRPWGRLSVNDETGEEAPIIKDRVLYVQDEEFSLDPGSLVGSWFLVIADGEMLWQGAVVAEPQAGRYLCHLRRLEEGAADVQRIFALDTLMGLGDESKRLLEGAIGEGKAPVVDPAMEWRIYDSEEKANAAFVEYETRSQRREREGA